MWSPRAATPFRFLFLLALRADRARAYYQKQELQATRMLAGSDRAARDLSSSGISREKSTTKSEVYAKFPRKIAARRERVERPNICVNGYVHSHLRFLHFYLRLPLNQSGGPLEKACDFKVWAGDGWHWRCSWRRFIGVGHLSLVPWIVAHRSLMVVLTGWWEYASAVYSALGATNIGGAVLDYKRAWLEKCCARLAESQHT
jgi:hypothetical protein